MVQLRQRADAKIIVKHVWNVFSFGNLTRNNNINIFSLIKFGKQIATILQSTFELSFTKENS